MNVETKKFGAKTIFTQKFWSKKAEVAFSCKTDIFDLFTAMQVFIIACKLRHTGDMKYEINTPLAFQMYSELQINLHDLGWTVIIIRYNHDIVL